MSTPVTAQDTRQLLQKEYRFPYASFNVVVKRPITSRVHHIELLKALKKHPNHQRAVRWMQSCGLQHRYI